VARWSSEAPSRQDIQLLEYASKAVGKIVEKCGYIDMVSSAESLRDGAVMKFDGVFLSIGKNNNTVTGLSY
jgi:hypothetical protein